ncbi:MAG: hypothetical protein JWR50_3474 [Mucilaginibacter sp.]|nr:hypothetical protein [Mucilaginibacter sp.]
MTNKTPDKSAKLKKTRWRTVVLIFAILLIFIGGIYWYNRKYLNLYYITTVYNPFKLNDKMYLNSFLVDKSSSKDFKQYNLSLYRMARPLNSDEVDNMNISLADKALIKQDLSSKKPYMEKCSWSISTDSLCKLKSAFIGSYSEIKIANIYLGKNQYGPGVFFIIHPMQKILVKENNNPPPSGYAFDNDLPFYIDATEVSTKESKTFRE